MSLEDQIRRLADARAAGVDTPDWRGRSPGGRGRWLLAAAAVVALLVIGAVIALSADDDADVDTADVEPTPTSPTSEPAPSPTSEPTTTSPEPTSPSTATTSTSTTTEPPPGQTGVCAANPVPDQDVLDLAVHLGPNRRPLDLDQDGVDDELLTYDDEDGSWWLIARLRDGWTTPARLGTHGLPELVRSPGGEPSAADLDDDGALEFFVAGPRLATAHNAELVSLHDCELRAPGAVLLIGGTSNYCLPTGCFSRVRCVAAATGPGVELIEELAAPAGNGTIVPDADPADTDVVWSATRLTFDGEILAPEETVEVTFPATEWPPEAPAAEDRELIDCTP